MTTTTFDGTSNTNWDNVANWDAGVPDETLDAVIDADCIMDNDGLCKSLTINASKYLDCNGQDLEVRSGMTDVYGILSSSTGEMKFWEGTTTGWGLQVRNGGKFHGGTGVHYIGSLTAYNNSSAICTLTSGITYMSGHYDVARIILQGKASTWDPNGGTVIILAGSTGGKIGPGSGGAVSDFYNLTIAMGAANTCGQYSEGMIVNGDFWVSGGIWDSNDSGGTKTFIVTGTTTIGTDDASAVDEATFITQETPVDLQGTDGSAPGLEMLAGGTFNGVGDANHSIGGVKALTTTYNSKIYLTSGTTTINQEMDSNMAWQTYSTGDVNLYHGNGTLKFTAPGYAFIYNNGQDFYDMIVDHAGAGGQLIALSLDLQIANDLTVSDGDFLKGDGKVLTVGNNCLVSGGAHSFTAEGGAFTVVNALIIGDDSSLTATDSTLSLGNLFMKSGSTFSMPAGTTTVTNNGSNDSGRTWFTRTNSTDPGPRTLTIPSGSMLMLPNGGTIEFDDSDYYYNITCSGTFETKNGNLHIDNDFRCNGWGPNGYAGYHFTVGNDFTKIGTSTFNNIDTGSNWTVSGNMIIESGKIDVHGRSALTPGDVNLKLYGNFINNGGDII